MEREFDQISQAEYEAYLNKAQKVKDMMGDTHQDMTVEQIAERLWRVAVSSSSSE